MADLLVAEAPESITYWEWLRDYQPLLNISGLPKLFGLEPDEFHQVVAETDYDRLWSYCVTETYEIHILAGYHVHHRQGFCITERAWPHVNLRVRLGVDPSCNGGHN